MNFLEKRGIVSHYKWGEVWIALKIPIPKSTWFLSLGAAWWIHLIFLFSLPIFYNTMAVNNPTLCWTAKCFSLPNPQNACCSYILKTKAALITYVFAPKYPFLTKLRSNPLLREREREPNRAIINMNANRVSWMREKIFSIQCFSA